MNTWKHFNNAAKLFASLILGIVQLSFAAEPNDVLMEIPPPPTLKGPRPAAESNTPASNSKKDIASVGTAKTATTSSVPSTGSRLNNSNDGMFAAVNKKAAQKNRATENAQKAAALAALNVPRAVTWGFQQFPAENTMYFNTRK